MRNTRRSSAMAWRTQGPLDADRSSPPLPPHPALLLPKLKAWVPPAAVLIVRTSAPPSPLLQEQGAGLPAAWYADCLPPPPPLPHCCCRSSRRGGPLAGMLIVSPPPRPCPCPTVAAEAQGAGDQREGEPVGGAQCCGGVMGRSSC